VVVDVNLSLLNVEEKIGKDLPVANKEHVRKKMTTILVVKILAIILVAVNV